MSSDNLLPMFWVAHTVAVKGKGAAMGRKGEPL